jgi:hypothetical protein
MRTRLLSLGIAALVWGFLHTGRAEAVPIVHGQGETITFLANLPKDAPVLKKAHNQQQPPTRLGYKYWRFHIFWADVWTAKGQFVVYQHERGGDTIKLGADAREAAIQAGLKPEQVAVPFFYRYPLGWWVGGGVLLFLVLKKLADKGNPTPEEPVKAKVDRDVELLRQAGAFEAMQLDTKDVEDLRMSDIQRGIDTLVSKGMQRADAEQAVARALEYLRSQ